MTTNNEPDCNRSGRTLYQMQCHVLKAQPTSQPISGEKNDSWENDLTNTSGRLQKYSGQLLLYCYMPYILRTSEFVTIVSIRGNSNDLLKLKFLSVETSLIFSTVYCRNYTYSIIKPSLQTENFDRIFSSPTLSFTVQHIID
jgi:hypothetical protein